MFLNHFEDVPDPHQRGKVIYPLDEVPLLCLLAVLAGAESIVDIARFTDAVREEVREWQSRPPDPVYPVVLFDALRVKTRDEGLVRNQAV